MIEKAEICVQSAEARIAKAEAVAQLAEARVQDYEVLINRLNASLAATRHELQEVHVSNHYYFLLADARQQQIQTFLASTSWRITVPIRMAGRTARAWSKWLKVAKVILKAKIKLVLANARLYVIRRPKLRHAGLFVLAKLPTLKIWLNVATVSSQFPLPIFLNNFENLTPHARKIYADLKAAIENNNIGAV